MKKSFLITYVKSRALKLKATILLDTPFYFAYLYDNCEFIWGCPQTNGAMVLCVTRKLPLDIKPSAKTYTLLNDINGELQPFTHSVTPSPSEDCNFVYQVRTTLPLVMLRTGAEVESLLSNLHTTFDNALGLLTPTFREQPAQSAPPSQE